MEMPDNQLEYIIKLLSEERLDQFLSICNADRISAIKLHQHSTHLSSGLMPVLGLIEIALRNSIDQQMRSAFGSEDWLIEPPNSFRWKGSELDRIKHAKRNAQRAVYAKMNNVEKRELDKIAFPAGIPPATSHKTHSTERQKAISVSNGKVIAQLTIFFWKRLFSEDYEATLWKPFLRKLFPNKTIHREDVSRHLEELYQMRNRVAHHEVIMLDRLTAVFHAVDFVSENLLVRARTLDSPLSRLLAPHYKALQERATRMNDFLKTL